MSDLDPAGLEAACKVLREQFGELLDRPVAEAAIRAYEAHKASAVPVNLPFERIPQHAWDPGVGPVPPRPTVEPLRPDTVPDEVTELVKNLRMLGDGAWDWLVPGVMRRAADLLEQMAGEIEDLKGALENFVLRLRITQELAQQLADLKTPPNHNE